MAKVKKILHMGLAPKDVKKALSFWSKHLGLKLTHEEQVKSDQVKTYFLPLGETQVEILEATSNESPIYKFLQKKGAGIHHLCLEVENLDGLLKDLKKDGVRLIDDKPRTGAHGCRIAFVHPESTGGILLELAEKY